MRCSIVIKVVVAPNVWVYERFGSSKRIPFKPLQSLLNVPPLKLALSVKWLIYCVVASTLLINFFEQLDNCFHC